MVLERLLPRNGKKKAMIGSPMSHDVFSPQKRSEIMSNVKCGDTSPELRVRSVLHKMGYRFRLHARSLPGSPDIVLKRYHSVILVHGCFWHQHPGCRRATLPTTRAEWWRAKLQRNVRRDDIVVRRLRDEGWSVLIIWECETHDDLHLHEVLDTFLAQGQP